MTSRLTIAVVHASVGSGHRIAAESVAAELHRLEADVDVHVLDILDFGAIHVSGDIASSAFTGPTAPVYNAAWGNAELGRAIVTASASALNAAFPHFEEWLRENQPDVVVATHALAANLAVKAMRNVELAHLPVVCVATDFGVHGYWPSKGLSLFCVADEYSALELLKRGMPRNAIAVTGIPVRSQFGGAGDSAAIRAQLDIPEHHKMVLAIAGASSPGPYVRFKSALKYALPTLGCMPDATLVVITGRDTDYARKLQNRAVRAGARNVRILGYTDQMAELMRAADLAVCKPGGLVTAECIASHLPAVLVGPSAGQERANIRALVRAGAAIACEEPRRLKIRVRNVLTNPAKIARMRDASVRLAHPGAAHDIAERVLALARGARLEHALSPGA
jgi:processive 1,2-diacylglycerol beta-glucosyltransferase